MPPRLALAQSHDTRSGTVDPIARTFNADRVRHSKSGHRDRSESTRFAWAWLRRFHEAGNGTFAAKVDYQAGSGLYTVAIGDLNGDGNLDVAVANGVANGVADVAYTVSAITLAERGCSSSDWR